jgi:YD repeat-containing protein
MVMRIAPSCLKKMTYAYQAPDAQVPDAFTIVQERGVVDGVVSEATELIFDGVNKRTLETQANVQHVHTYERDVVFKQEIQHGDGSTQLMGGDTTHSVDFRPEVVADNYNAQTNMGWSVDGKNLESVTDALGNATNFTYDTENRLTESVDAENRSTRYTYVGDTRQPATMRCGIVLKAKAGRMCCYASKPSITMTRDVFWKKWYWILKIMRLCKKPPTPITPQEMAMVYWRAKHR